MRQEENILHDYLDIIRKHEKYMKAITNILNVMKLSRNNYVCNEDFSNICFGNVRMDGIMFSRDGVDASCFDHCQIHSLNFRSGHCDAVTFVRFSSDSNMIMTGSCEDIIVWERETGQVISKFSSPFSKIVNSAILSDGVHAVTLAYHKSTDYDGMQMTIWNIADGTPLIHLNDNPSDWIMPDWIDENLMNEISSFINHHEPVSEIILKDSNGVITANACMNNEPLCVEDMVTPVLWDTEKRKIMTRFCGHEAPVRDMDISQDQKYLATASEDNTVIIWNIKLGKPDRILRAAPWVKAVAISPNMKQYLAGSSNTKVHLMQTNGYKYKYIGSMESGAASVGFTAYGEAVIGSWDHKVYIINLKNNYSFSGRFYHSPPVAVSSGHNLLAIGYFDGSTQILDIDRKTQSLRVRHHNMCGGTHNTVTSAAVSKTGRYVLFSTWDYSDGSSVWIMDLNESSEMKLHLHIKSKILTLAISPNEYQYCIGTEHSCVMVIPFNSVDDSIDFRGMHGCIVKVKFLENWKITAISNYETLILDLKNNSYNSFGFGDMNLIEHADISDDGRLLVAVHQDQVYLVNPYTENKKIHIIANLNLMACSFEGVQTDTETLKMLRQYGAYI